MNSLPLAPPGSENMEVAFITKFRSFDCCLWFICLFLKTDQSCFKLVLWVIRKGFFFFFFNNVSIMKGLSGDPRGKESTCQCRRRKRPDFHTYVGNVPWSRKRQSSLVLLPGKAPRIDNPGRLQSIWSQRVGHEQSYLACTPVYPETHPRHSCWHMVVIHSMRLSSRVKSKT